MAASTLATLLVKLGFDVSSLPSGGRIARSELDAIKASAQATGAVLGTTAAALNNMARAANLTAGSTGATTNLTNLAKAAKAVDAATGGAPAAMNNFARSAEVIASTTGSGAALNAYAKAIMAIAGSAGVGAAELGIFARAAAAVAAQTGSPGAVINFARQAAATAGAAAGAGPPLASVGAAAAGAGTSLQKAAGAAGATAGALSGVSGPAAKAAASMNNVAHAALNAADRGSFMNRTLSMAFAFSGGVMVTNVIGFVSTALAGFNSRLEQARIAFTTLLGSTGQADAFIAKMEAFANITPFEFSNLQDAVQRLLAMGFAADDVLPVLRAVGDAVAALGGDKEKLDRVTLALGQMLTAGRVNAQDMRQLTEAGIPAWDILSKAIGKTIAETRKLAERGLIPANQAVVDLVNGMEEAFGGMMAKQARTAQGAFSTIHDAALQTISGAVKPAFDIISQGMVAIADFLVSGGGKYIAPVIYGIGTAIAVALIPRIYGAAVATAAVSVSLGTMTTMVDGVAVSVARFSIPLVALIVAVSTLAIAWQENWGGMRDTLGPAVGALGSAVGAIAGFLGSIGLNAGLLVSIVTALAAAITGKLVFSLIAATIAAIAHTGANTTLAYSYELVIVGAVGASRAVTGFAAASSRLLLLVGGIPGVVGLWVAALVLLVINFDRVAQGWRVLIYAFVSGIKSLVDLAASIPFIGDAFKGLQSTLQDVQNDIIRDMATAEAAIDAKSKALGEAGADTNPLADMKKKLEDAVDSMVNETESLVERFGTTLQGVVNAAKEAGGKAMAEMATAIRDAQDAPLNALKSLHEMVRNQLLPTAEVARLIGMLTAQDLVEGLASGDAATFAQAEATKKLITERLDEITGGAYSAGANVVINLANGMSSNEALSALADAIEKVEMPVAAYLDKLSGTKFFSTAITEMVYELRKPAQLVNEWNTKWAPSADAVANGIKGINDELRKTEAYTSGLSALNSAFSEILSSANKYFDALHNRNLQAIEDACKQKNAILDAKAALNQAPVTAAQAALDWRRRQIEEWRLREAVRTATDPAARRDAILALQDFLAQAHIDDMQSEVDAANAVLETQKAANDRKAELAKAAEDARYEAQKDNFERQLELLRRYLEKHPGEWQNANAKVLKLLKDFGIDYKRAGALLGANFAAGLEEQVAAAVAAVLAMADLIPGLIETVLGPMEDYITTILGPMLNAGGGTTSTAESEVGAGGGGGGGAAHHAQAGMWNIMQDNLLTMLHHDEMVAPAEIASLLRQLGSRPMASGGGWATLAPSSGWSGSSAAQTALSGRTETGGRGGTLIVQIGEEKFAEIVDRSLSIQEPFSGRRIIPSTGSLR